MNTKTNTRTDEQVLERLMNFGPYLIAIIASCAVATIVLFGGELTATDQALSLTIAGIVALIAGPAFFLAVKKFS